MRNEISLRLIAKEILRLSSGGRVGVYRTIGGIMIDGLPGGDRDVVIHEDDYLLSLDDFSAKHIISLGIPTNHVCDAKHVPDEVEKSFEQPVEYAIEEKNYPK